MFFNGPDDDGIEYDQGQGGQEDVAKPSQPQHVHIHVPGRRFFITMILWLPLFISYYSILVFLEFEVVITVSTKQLPLVIP